MATTLQFRRGTEAQAQAFTGAEGELFIDMDNDILYLHDGSTPGGFRVKGIGNPVVSGAVENNTLTLTLADSSTVDIDVSSLSGTTGGNPVESGTVNGTTLTLTLEDETTIDIDVSTLSGTAVNAVESGAVNDTTLTLTLADDTTIDIDVTSLAGTTGGDPVVSGTINETDLILTLESGDTITIDVSSLAGTIVNTGITDDDAVAYAIALG